MISAYDFDVHDRCPRRYALERDYESRSISTTGLLYAGVEGGILAPDGAIDAIRAITTRKDVDSGQLAAISAIRHVGFAAEVISLALCRRFGRFTRLDPIKFGKHEWQSNLFQSKHGLHRIILVAHLDDDSLRGYAHSWGTVGELAALQQDVILTAVVTGAQRAGRRHSHWTRAFRHPVQRSALRFARRKGGKNSGFTDGWTECWRESSDIAADVWLNQMEADDVVSELIKTHRVAYKPDDIRIQRARKDMLKIIQSMHDCSVDDPMRYSSCDELGRGPCPFQPYCWSPSEVDISDFSNLYRIKEAPISEGF